MKKYLLILFCAVLVTANFNTANSANVKVDSTSVNASKSTSMDSVMYADGKDVLKSIKVAGKDLATNGYDVMVQQQRMYAYMYLFVGFLALVFGWLFIVFYRKADKQKPNTIIPSVIFFGMLVWMLIVFGNHYNDVFQGLFNPDYAAIKDIVSLFKTGSGNTGVAH